MDYGSSEIKILCCRYEENIYPWVIDDLYTPYWRLYWNVSNGAELRYNGRTVQMSPEQIYIVPGYIKFSSFAEKSFAQFYIHFNPEKQLRSGREIYSLPCIPTVMELIEQFRARQYQPEFARRDLLTALGILSLALLQLPDELLRAPDGYDQRIEELRNWLNYHAVEAPSNHEMAEKLRMEINSFIRLFHAETGESPQHYVRRKRVERACELLHFSMLPIDDIATETGFANRYHFTRVFSQTMQITPAHFRRIGLRHLYPSKLKTER